jgi:hypothetical protein
MEYPGCWVHVRINWDTAHLDPNGASVYFFPKEGGTPYVLWTNYTSDSLYLPAGNYSALVFNERVSEHDNIAFRGTHTYETFEVYALTELSTPDFLRYQAQVNPEMSKTTKVSVSTLPPDVLAVANMDLVSITQAMVQDNNGPVLEFTPRRVTAELQVTVRISGLQYAAFAASCGGSLSGMTAGIMLATGQPTTAQTTQYFTFRHAEFDAGSDDQGFMQTTFNTFGPCNTNWLWMQFLLRDGAIFMPDADRNVTGRFEYSADRIRLFLSAGQLRWEKDDPVVLPYAEPDEGMFRVELNDWADGEVFDTQF